MALAASPPSRYSLRWPGFPGFRVRLRHLFSSSHAQLRPHRASCLRKSSTCLHGKSNLATWLTNRDHLTHKEPYVISLPTSKTSTRSASPPRDHEISARSSSLTCPFFRGRIIPCTEILLTQRAEEVRRCTSILVVGITLLLAGSAAAEDAKTLALGIGTRSCSFWQSKPSLVQQGGAWIFGFWTALNFANSKNRAVGSQTNGDGIIAAVKKTCAERPSEILEQATLNAYRAMEK